MADDLDWIREGLKKPGKTQSGLAEAFKRAPSAITNMLKGGRQLKAKEIAIAANYLEVEPPSRGAETKPDQPQIPPARPTGLIPVYGPARGGTEDRLEFSEVIDHIPPPPKLAGVADAYVVYIAGESMEPRYFAGEGAFIHPRIPVRRDDFVVVQFYPAEDDQQSEGLVKQFVHWTLTKLVVRQFNPEKRIEIDKRRVKSVHRIVLAGEV